MATLAITLTRTSTTTIFGGAFVTATKTDSTAATNTGNIRTARISCLRSPSGRSSASSRFAEDGGSNPRLAY